MGFLIFFNLLQYFSMEINVISGFISIKLKMDNLL